MTAGQIIKVEANMFVFLLSDFLDTEDDACFEHEAEQRLVVLHRQQRQIGLNGNSLAIV